MALAHGRTTGPVPGRIATLNDELRRNGRGGRAMVTAGVAGLPEIERAAIIAAVCAFDTFDPDNDPYGEHDFGAVEVLDEGDVDLRPDHGVPPPGLGHWQ